MARASPSTIRADLARWISGYGAQAENTSCYRVLGPEPLGNEFHEAHLVQALAGKNTPIKTALLDQGIIAGLGNIYVCEALFRAGISPKRKGWAIFLARRVSRRWFRSFDKVLLRMPLMRAAHRSRISAKPMGNLDIFSIQL